MILGSRIANNSQQSRDRGSISLFAVVLFFALMAAAGLVFNGGAKIRAAREAAAVAEEAARAGAGRINPPKRLHPRRPVRHRSHLPRRLRPQISDRQR